MDLSTDGALAAAKRLSGLLVTYSTLIIGILILVVLIIWGTNKLTLNATNCKNMNTLYKNMPSKLVPYLTVLKDNADENFDLEQHRRIGDFYIKTAYNCCCAGNFKNDFVDICALENCIKQGARCLDFEIYSVKNEPVIAASSVDDDTVKETYNSVSFGDAMSTVANMAFDVPSNKDDPLLINLRIMSNNAVIYNKIAKIINDTLKNHMLPTCNAFSNRGKNAGDIPIGALTKKVLIMADYKNGENFLATDKKSKLPELINLAGNTIPNTFYNIERYTTIMNETVDNVKAFTRDYMMMCLPDLDINANNPNFNIPYHRGCQLIGMCFQKEDANLEVYHEKFNTSGSAFIKKNTDLQKLLTCIPTSSAPPLKKTTESKPFNPLKMSGISLPAGQPMTSFTV